jgi:hypothetical protein
VGDRLTAGELLDLRPHRSCAVLSPCRPKIVAFLRVLVSERDPLAFPERTRLTINLRQVIFESIRRLGFAFSDFCCDAILLGAPRRHILLDNLKPGPKLP